MSLTKIQENPLQDHHLMELATLAIKARDTYKMESTDIKIKMQAVLNEIERLKIQIEGRDAAIKKLESDLDDERSNNAMLQRMLKRMVKEAKNS